MQNEMKIQYFHEMNLHILSGCSLSSVDSGMTNTLRSALTFVVRGLTPTLSGTMSRLLIIVMAFCGLAALADAEPKGLIKAGDSIKMEVFNEEELTTRTKLLQSGEAVFPLVGSVNLGGLTIQQATEKITGLYATDYLVAPKVSLTIEEYAVIYVDVMGSVTTPGRVPLPPIGNLDLSMAIASAGGLTPSADPDGIEVVGADGSRRVFSIASLKANGGAQLKAGDRVVVAESRFSGKILTIRGQIKKPGPMRFPVNGKLDLVTAIALAGDLTDLANQRKITVTRGDKVFTLDLREYTSDTSKRFYLQPGDLINVPERLF
jgi:polysaccharide biosynthesis/export protein